jgi:hypothetical protein
MPRRGEVWMVDLGDGAEDPTSTHLKHRLLRRGSRTRHRSPPHDDTSRLRLLRFLFRRHSSSLEHSWCRASPRFLPSGLCVGWDILRRSSLPPLRTESGTGSDCDYLILFC